MPQSQRMPSLMDSQPAITGEAGMSLPTSTKRAGNSVNAGKLVKNA
jgi:hypothetical protein